MLIEFHDSGLITTSVAIVRGGEDCDDVPFMCPVVSIHDELMCAGDPHQGVRVVELL